MRSNSLGDEMRQAIRTVLAKSSDVSINQFVAEVERTIAAYLSLRGFSETVIDPKDSYNEIVALRDQVTKLTTTLYRTSSDTERLMGQMFFLETGQYQPKYVELNNLLENLELAAQSAIHEFYGGEKPRRGSDKHDATNFLVNVLADRFAEIAEYEVSSGTDSAFLRVMETILPSVLNKQESSVREIVRRALANRPKG